MFLTPTLHVSFIPLLQMFIGNTSTGHAENPAHPAEEEEAPPHPIALPQGCQLQLTSCLLPGFIWGPLSCFPSLPSCGVAVLDKVREPSFGGVWARWRLSSSILGFHDELRLGWRDTFLQDSQMVLSIDVGLGGSCQTQGKRDLLHASQLGLSGSLLQSS